MNKNKIYKLKELLKEFSMYNLDFSFYGNNDKGELELYLKTDDGKLSVFKSIKNQTKADYLKLTEEEAQETEFKFDREVSDIELDIVVIVYKTSDINIPSSKYSLNTLNKLVIEQDNEERKTTDGLEDGIVYAIVDQNTGCTLYDNVYLFNKNNGGLINELKKEYEKEEDKLIKDNLKLILDYYDNLEKELNYTY